MSIKKVVVAGGGVLGSQIALQSAYCGFDVTIWLRSEGSIERAKPKLERFKNIYIETLEAMKTDANEYCRGLAATPDLSDGELDELKQKAQDAYDNLTLTTSYEDAAKDADLIIEAIAENPEQKIAFYKNIWKKRQYWLQIHPHSFLPCLQSIPEDLKSICHFTLQTPSGKTTQLK